MKAIAAVSENWGIGKDNDLLFHISADMKNFRKTTTDCTVIMGRKTLESFPGSKPLPKRINIVITRNPDYKKEGAIVVNSLDGAIKEAERYGKEIFVIGGAQVYASLLDRCNECIITKVFACPKADSFFPNLDEKNEWKVSEESEVFEENGTKFQFVVYRRI